MSPVARMLLSFVFTYLMVPANALPSFDIDLDLAPEKRWAEVTSRYKKEMIAMHKTLHPILEKHLGKAREAWLKVAPFDPEYEAELKGIATTVNDVAVNVKSLKLMNMLYELASPTACSGVLWATSNGTVMHGRNMDYKLDFKMPDGSPMDWPNVTFDATFHKAGKPLFKATTWPGYIGVHTGMRFGGWSFEQNTRAHDNLWHGWHQSDAQANLKAANEGGKLFGMVARKMMETVPHFKEAVAQLNATKFMAPSFFILSGAGPFEGAVLSVDRLAKHFEGTPPMLKVNNPSTLWNLVQTNDDILDTKDGQMSKTSLYQSLDQRRPIANYMLSGATQEIVSEEHLMQFMHTSPLFWNETVFSTVMVPAKDYFKTVLPDEPPGAIKRELFANAPPSLASVATTRSLRGAPHAHASSSNRQHHLRGALSQLNSDASSFMQLSSQILVREL